MPPELRRRLLNPFDDYEVKLLELVANSQALAAVYAKKAQDEANSDTVALHSYISHMEEIARTRAYNNALWVYRQMKKEERIQAELTLEQAF